MSKTINRVTKIQKLLLHFNLSAFAFDPGVKCLVLGDKSFQIRYIDFDKSTWEFIEPLLKELIAYRKYGKWKYGNNFINDMKIRRRRKEEI